MKCCLIGEKLGHSYSKIIHDSFGKYSYDLVEVEPDLLENFVKNGDYDAYNVTIPYKEKIISMLDFVDDAAKSIGAVNTVFRKNGKTYGYNTDFKGMKYMLSLGNIFVKDKNVVILGGGGTSKTAQAVCRSEGAKTITVVSRRGENNYENCQNLIETEVIINATPVGMYPKTDACPIDVRIFPKLEAVADVIYNPLNTKLIINAKKSGLKTVSGLSMLVAQAKFAMDIFLDKPSGDEQIAAVYKKLQNSTQNIVLIGMPGSGKSSVGKEIAKRLGKKFVDLDVEIVKQAGMSIPDIFEKFGESYFREIESQTAHMIGKENGQVIACGGGVVLDKNNYFFLKANGIIVRLYRSVEKLATTGRPLSKSLSALKEMERIRNPFYQEFADFTEQNNGYFYDCVDNIMEKLNENFDY